MNAKDIKKYSLVSSIINSHPREEGLAAAFAELAAVDFTTGFEVFEYMLNAYARELADPATASNLEGRVFPVFVAQSESNTRRLFAESLPLCKLIYTASASSCTGANLTFIAGLILSSKLDTAEEALRCVRANSTPGFDFGARMKDILDTVFALYCTKNDVKKCELNKKQSALLLDYIQKIKGPYKQMLVQRIKEL
jgi:hypothetical protein